MTALECSGLVTLVKRSKKSKLKQKFITIPKGTDFASITDPELYGEYIIRRKALIVDVSTDLNNYFNIHVCSLVHITLRGFEMKLQRQLTRPPQD